MEPKLGQKIPDDIEVMRDAIHVAVFPCIADDNMEPGTAVRINEDGTASDGYSDNVGIVDPFLDCPVYVGEKFWVFLFPNTVTGMRHQWQHPDLDHICEPEPVTKPVKDIDDIIDPNAWSCCSQVDIDGGWTADSLTETQRAALERIRKFAEEYYATPSRLIDQAVSGETLFFGTEIYGDVDFERDLREFWTDISLFTGRYFSTKHRDNSGYRCGC